MNRYRTNAAPIPPPLVLAISALVRQVYRWHFAATQDENPVVKNLHANYAVGYVGALRSIATEAQVMQAVGVSLPLLEREVIATQDAALLRLFELCPGLIPESPAYRQYIAQFLRKK
jgi:hypothetical protein